MTIKELGEKYADYCVSMRRYFHQHPELSRQEVETSKRVKEELDKMGLAWRAIADNGVLCDIGGKKPGKCILLRADMDALQVQEETGFEFASYHGNGGRHGSLLSNGLLHTQRRFHILWIRHSVRYNGRF